MPRLPPLSTLPVLEAAARLGSFSAAADELHVTHGAVSHQIKSLESFVGLELFSRKGRSVALTAEGAALAEAVRAALNNIDGVLQKLNSQQRQRRLCISSMPSFTSRWLMPRLGHFLEKYPQFEVSVEATQALANFVTDNIDAAIRYGVGPWAGLHCDLLAHDSYFPVCSPRYRKGKLPTRPEQLAKLPLFRSDHGNWEKWFAAAGVKASQLNYFGIEYNDSGLYLHLLEAGEGIALTRRSLVSKALDSGRLVKLFDIEIDDPKSYYLVCLPQHVNSPKIRAFRDWIKQEIDW